MGGEGRAHPYSLGCASVWMLGPGYWARGGRRSAVYGCDRRTVMELCFTGISSKKGIPAAKSRRDTLFAWRKSLFATQRHFSELQEVLKNGDHHRAGTPFRVSRTHPSAPLAKGSHFGGQTQGIPAAKPSGYPWRKSLFATLSIFQSFKRSSEKWGSSSCRTPFRVSRTPFRPLAKGFLFGGADSGYPGGKSRRDTLFHRFSGPFRRRGDFCVKYDNKM